MKASILAVGTEITTGQILNKNAQSLSQKLIPLGIHVSFQLAVPDDRQLIFDALTVAETQSDIIFVTGGLGPTSDDFTRELISEWAQLPLQFHESSWAHVQERLTSRGFSVRDMQRQQCFFPATSEIMKNSQGTANAFYFEIAKPTGLKTVFVLPGPPREIESIWNEHIAIYLKKKTLHLIRSVTKSWDTMGMGESDVADLVETEVKNFSDLRDLNVVQIGYRVHLPYVEVKITFAESQLAKVQPLLIAIDVTLKKITVSKDFVDLATDLFQNLQSIDFAIYDFVSDGFLLQRMQSHLKTQKNFSWRQSSTSLPPDFFDQETNFIALLPLGEDQKCLFIFDLGGKRRQLVLESPFKSTLMSDRRRQYFAEMAIIQAAKLKASCNTASN